jgi:hypothetical protein
MNIILQPRQFEDMHFSLKELVHTIYSNSLFFAELPICKEKGNFIQSKINKNYEMCSEDNHLKKEEKSLPSTAHSYFLFFCKILTTFSWKEKKKKKRNRNPFINLSDKVKVSKLSKVFLLAFLFSEPLS